MLCVPFTAEDLSIASALAHAKTLRQCGLISSTRDGMAVRHTLTRLGEQLLATCTGELASDGRGDRVGWDP
jgi:hypothetical protein